MISLIFWVSAILWAFHAWWPDVPAPWHPYVPFVFWASLILLFVTDSNWRRR